MQDIDYTYLFAGMGVLIAVLALWSILWVSFAKSEGEDKDDDSENRLRKASASLGLFWVYSATLIALLSVAFILMGKYWENLRPGLMDWLLQLGFGFLMTAVIMALLNIFQSASSVFIKGLQEKTAFDSHLGLDPKKLKIYLPLNILLIALLLTFSTVGVLKNHCWWWGYLPTLLLGACVFWYAIKPGQGSKQFNKR